jgi:competence protein ComFC
VTVPFAFAGEVRSLILAAKYQGRPGGLTFLSGRLAALIVERKVKAEVITWVPTAPIRKSTRGYDQAELLAKHVGSLMGLPCERLLLHRPDRHTQTGLSAADRAVHASSVFRPVSGFGQRYEDVLLVDDVMTTGATLRAGASALRTLGAQRVHAAVVAATL